MAKFTEEEIAEMDASTEVWNNPQVNDCVFEPVNPEPEKILKVLKFGKWGKQFKIEYVERYGSIYAKVFKNGIYLSPCEWPIAFVPRIEIGIEQLIQQHYING